MMWLVKIIHAGLALAHAAIDGKVTTDEAITVLQVVFPEDVDAVLEEIRKDLDTDDKISVDDAMKIISAIAG